MISRFELAVILVLAVNIFFAAKAVSRPHAPAVKSAVVQENIVFESTTTVPDPNNIFKLVNDARSASRKQPLTPNKALGAIAAARAADMSNRKYYAHKSPDGTYYYDLLNASELKPQYSCENLNLVFVPDNTKIINDWLNSRAGHRECMLNDNIKQAGYASAEVAFIDATGSVTTAYVVVAVHTTEI